MKNLDPSLVRNSQEFYMGKSVNLFSCPTKYYWVHHMWVHPKEDIFHFTFGSAIHKAGEAFLLHSEAEAVRVIREQLTIESQSLALEMISYFIDEIKKIKNFTLISTEFPGALSLTNLSSFFTKWRVKADFIYADIEGHWNADIKTTASTGPKVAEYYHNSPQTLTYFLVMQKLLPNLIGSKIFVLTKKKVRCEVEPILFNLEKLYRAESYINHAVLFADYVENIIIEGGKNYEELRYSLPKFQIECDSYFNKSCPYKPLCFNQRGPKYQEDLIQDWFEIKDPDEHLELEKGASE